jgi:RNA polymerase sigma-70 factor (ECF subfamily)
MFARPGIRSCGFPALRSGRHVTVAELAEPAQGTLETADRRLLRRLRAGEEEAFAELVDRFGASMIRAARSWVSSRAVAEEVVQETWLRVLGGLDRFEGRSSLSTWIFAILGNCARRRAQREGRSIPFASVAPEGAPEPGDFFPADHPRWPGAWSTVVDGSFGVPEERLLGAEVRDRVAEAIAALPRGQRDVLALRDVEGWSAEETCSFLGLTPANQRVLLHRARARVRSELRSYLGEPARV